MYYNQVQVNLLLLNNELISNVVESAFRTTCLVTKPCIIVHHRSRCSFKQLYNVWLICDQLLIPHFKIYFGLKK